MTTLSAKFQPQPDITAYELAQIVRGFLMAGPITIPAENWDRIPPEARRHLALQDPAAPASNVHPLFAPDEAQNGRGMR